MPRLDLDRIRCSLRAGWLLILLTLCQAAQITGQETPESNQAFDTALKAFEGQFWEQADRDFGEFASRFPKSPRLAEAILFQARSRFALKNYEGALALLTQHGPQAGPLSDQYKLWTAESLFSDQRFDGAAKAYREVLTSSTNASINLQAGYGEAWSHFRLRDYDRAVQLLRDPNGAFVLASRGATNDATVAQGQLLLAEALFSKKDYTAAEQVLNGLANPSLPPDLEWQRLYSLALAAKAAQRPQDAIETAGKLVAFSSSSVGKPVLHASALMLQADVLKEREAEAAIKAYEQIVQIKGIPASQTRQAWLGIVDLLVAQNRLTNAIERLKTFVAEPSPESPVDLLRLTLGELHLKQFYNSLTNAPASVPDVTQYRTNLLHQAQTHFDVVINALTNNPLIVGKAHLHRGWTLWEEAQVRNQPAKILDSRAAFQAAVDRLPVSEDKAVALFKVADCEFHQRNYTNAVQTYGRLVEEYAGIPEVKSKWLEQALSQTIRAAVEIAGFPEARKALDQMIEWFPSGALTGRAVLSLSKALLDRRETAAAREILSRFQARVPGSEFRAEMELAGARSYLVEGEWVQGISHLDKWLADHTNHTARSQAQFDLAWTHFQAGQGTNALTLFTNFVAQTPRSPLTPLAQLWVADYFYNNGEHTSAERHYQLLFQDTNAPVDLRYRARLYAGRSALLRDKPSDARNYLTNLVNDSSCPSTLLPDAYFLLGEVELKEPVPPGLTNSLSRFDKAAVAFDYIVRIFPTNRLEPLARGKLANCYFQLASANPSLYDSAIAEYTKVLESPLADVTVRSQAEVALGSVLEHVATQRSASEGKELLRRALDHYLNVLNGKRLNARKGERADPFWVKEAGVAAGRLAEQLNLVPQAVRTYERLLRQLPQLAPEARNNLKRRLDALQNQTPKS